MTKRRTRFWRDQLDQPTFPSGVVAAIGVFDGVHRGHRALLGIARNLADTRGLPLVVITFHPHPIAVLRPGEEPHQLATIRHRGELLSEAGADGVHLLDFTPELSQTSPHDFVAETIAALPAKSVVVGSNFRFGHKAAGDIEALVGFGQEYGFDVTAVPLLADEEDGEVWSSTRIRQALQAGDIGTATEGLHRRHRVEGLVVRGDQRGRELGYPTANLNPAAAAYGAPPALPADGVYAGYVVLNPHAPGTTHLPAAISVGTNPTFTDGSDRRVEAYVLDRNDLSLYGQIIGVEFVERLRGQETFAEVADLIAQMDKDVALTRSLLSAAATG